jgi:hypothetical protein
MIHRLVKILLLLISLTFPFWAVFSYGRVSLVSCLDSLSNPCPPDIHTYFQAFNHQPILLLKPAEIKSRFSQKFISFKLSEIMLVYPHLAKFVIQPLPPLAILKFPDYSQYLSANGVVLTTTPTALPIIYQDNPIIVQSTKYDDSVILSSLRLLEQLALSSLHPQEIIIHDQNNLEVILATQVKILFSSTQSITDQVSTLQRILLTTTMRKDQLVDIRYDIPVIKDISFPASVATDAASPSGFLKEEGV